MAKAESIIVAAVDLLISDEVKIGGSSYRISHIQSRFINDMTIELDPVIVGSQTSSRDAGLSMIVNKYTIFKVKREA